jgi:hypothetical protein
MHLSRRTLAHGALGAVVGSVLGFVPLVVLVAPLFGGGVAGYLERDGSKQGAVAGAFAGVLMAALSSIITGTILFARFGDLPFTSPDEAMGGLVVAATLSVLASLGQLLVAGLGGALGGVLEATHTRERGHALGRVAPAGERGRRHSLLRAAGSLIAGFVIFAVVGVSVTAVLDPLIWPSAIVGLPIGIVAGTAVAVLGYHYLTHRPDPTRHWRGVAAGVVAVVVVFALALGGLSLLGQQRLDESYQSTYEYRVTLTADGTLENATVYVPVPAAGNDSAFGERFVENVRYDRSVPSFRGSNATADPVNFTYDLVETDQGPMVAIRADRVPVTDYYYREVENESMGYRERIDASEYDPADPDMGVQHDGRFTFLVTVVADDPIDTADPFDTEPLLSSQSDRTSVDCRFESADRGQCYESTGRVYADYETANGTTVAIGTELTGRNEWFAGGWRGNEYRQRSSVALVGPHSGWHRTGGDLEVGVGTYR